MKKALVLLPAMMCDEWMFLSLIHRLSKQFSIHIGNLTGPSTMSGIAERILSRIPAQQFAVVGISLGGIVAMEMMQQSPERIERVALISTDHLPERPERRALHLRQMSEVRAGRFIEVIRNELASAFSAAGEAHHSDNAGILEDMALDLGPETFLSQSLALMTKGDYSKMLSAWRKPAMIVCGENDRLCPPNQQKAMASLLQESERHVIPGAAHLLTLEEPRIVNDLLAKFLTS